MAELNACVFLLLLLLLFVQIGVVTILGHQLLMRTAFHHAAFVEHNNQIKIEERKDTVRNDDRRFVFQV